MAELKMLQTIEAALQLDTGDYLGFLLLGLVVAAAILIEMWRMRE